MTSIIVPTYNYAKYLPACLESVKRQSYSEWECLIIDDGSTDDTETVVSYLIVGDDRFKYYRTENRGLSAARNYGLRLAQGDFLQFLDADDLLMSQKIELQTCFLERNDDIDVIIGPSRYFTADASSIKYLEYHFAAALQELSQNEIISSFFNRNLFTVSAPLIRKSGKNNTVFFDELLKGFEDWDYWIRLALAGTKFHCSSDTNCTTLIRRRAGSMMTNFAMMYEQEVIVRRKYRNSDVDFYRNFCYAQARLIDAYREKNGVLKTFITLPQKVKYFSWYGILAYPWIALSYKMKQARKNAK